MCVHPKCHRPGGRMQDQSLAKPRRRRPQAKLSETDVLIMWAAGQNCGRWSSRNRSRRNAFSKRPDGRMDLGNFCEIVPAFSPRCDAPQAKKSEMYFLKRSQVQKALKQPAAKRTVKDPQATRRRTNRKGVREPQLRASPRFSNASDEPFETMERTIARTRPHYLATLNPTRKTSNPATASLSKPF